MAFSKLPADDRMVALMRMDLDPGARNADLLRYAVQHDSDQHVRFAALKRVHLFKDDPSLQALLVILMNDPSSKGLEPYLSMALLRFGLITENEFNRKINDQ